LYFFALIMSLIQKCITLKGSYISLFSYFLFPNMSKNVSDLSNYPSYKVIRSTTKYRIKPVVFRSAALQPTSNSHLEKLLIMPFKLLNQC
jgi:hypothetical protein